MRPHGVDVFIRLRLNENADDTNMRNVECEVVSRPCRSSIGRSARSVSTAKASASPASKSRRKARTRSRLPAVRRSIHTAARTVWAPRLPLSFHDYLCPYLLWKHHPVAQSPKERKCLNPSQIHERRSPKTTSSLASCRRHRLSFPSSSDCRSRLQLCVWNEIIDGPQKPLCQRNLCRPPKHGLGLGRV